MELILKDITEFIIDCEHKTAPIQDIGFPSIRTPNIGKGNLILEGVNRVSAETYKEWTKRGEPQEGDLIIAREAPVGNVAIIPKNLKVCLGQRTVLVRPNKLIVNSKYLCYLLLGEELQGQILTKTTGATVSHLNMRDIRELKLPKLPPLATQQKIASILSAYDELIENNKQRIKLLESMAEEIYKEWFVRLRFPNYENTQFVDGLPIGWKEGNLTEIIDILSGGTPQTAIREFWNGTIPFFSPKDYNGDIFCYETEGNITELGLKNCNSSLFAEDTVLITARGTVGNIVLTGRPMAMNQSCFALRGKLNISNYYIYQLLSNNVKFLKKVANGATFSAITIKNFEQTKIIRPSLNLIQDYAYQTDSLFKMIKVLLQKNQLLQQTRDLLLPRLISGKLRVEEKLYKIEQNEMNVSMAAEFAGDYEAK